MREPDPLDPEALYTANQAGNRSGICPHRIRKAIHRGGIENVFKIGTWYRFRWRDFERWVESHRYVPPEPSAVDREAEARVQAQLRREAQLPPKSEAARGSRATSSNST